nr:reverse transcriptase domain-containing protein [Tanacetum cinerariifolium]
MKPPKRECKFDNACKLQETGKGVMPIKQGKLNPWYIGPFMILKRVGPMAYTLELPKELKVEDLKKQLEIVNDEDDDVFIEATPLGRKVPVVDYHIVMINNKPRYKIIKADETHQFYISFITLLKNFDREDLEDL